MFNISVFHQYYPIFLPQSQFSQLIALSLNANQSVSHSFNKTVKKKAKPIGKAVSSVKQTPAERAALKDGLKKSLDSTNKGFELLKKMGYEEGTPLGRCRSGMVEPLAITLRNKSNSRAGLGQVGSVPDKELAAKSLQKLPAPAAPNEVEKENEIPVASTKREKRMQQLQLQHRKEIELLRLRLEEQVPSSDSLIIAIVAIDGQQICSEVFEIIHQYLVNSLHVYTGTPFPLFHDISNVDDHVKVICGDESSFEYLSACIGALSSSISMTITTTRVSPMDGDLYWFSVQMPGLVGGPQSFLSQIKKHRFGLRPDNWIIVSQNPCSKTNKTHLQIITDEHSALLLIYKHSMKLLVCMQEMDFVLRGKCSLRD